MHADPLQLPHTMEHGIPCMLPAGTSHSIALSLTITPNDVHIISSL